MFTLLNVAVCLTLHFSAYTQPSHRLPVNRVLTHPGKHIVTSLTHWTFIQQSGNLFFWFFSFSWLPFISLQFCSTNMLTFSERQAVPLRLLDTSCLYCPSLPGSLLEAVQPICDYTACPSRKMDVIKGSKSAISGHS